MNCKVEKTKNANEVKLEITIEAEKFENAIKKVYFQNAKYFNIPGFRKGKAPQAIVEKYYGKEIFYEDAFNDIASEEYEKAVEEKLYKQKEEEAQKNMETEVWSKVLAKTKVLKYPEEVVNHYVETFDALTDYNAEQYGLDRKDFIAQYTEQATGVVPVFLSIRKNDKILFKIHVIVPDVETADKIQRHWTENAQAAYESTWKSIAGDLPMPVFD